MVLDEIGEEVSQSGKFVKVSIAPDGNLFSFYSMDGFPGDPVVIHVSEDAIATGFGPSRMVVSEKELQNRLDLLVLAAYANDVKSAVLLVSDEGVSGEFGFSILEILGEVGVEVILLRGPDMEIVPKPSAKKPSPPTQ